ncbi:MAG: DUF3798 domain-containing protein [Clostridiales bacterium]|nr:DUF3798 domain-containing protein [Clostridiales bacterium]
MRKLLALVMALALLLGMMLPATAETAGYKIGIMTGTTTQGEEEYRAAEKLAQDFPDIVITDTYPDNFNAEVETTIGKLLQMASDPEVKAIIMTQAVAGAVAAFTQIRETRPDILLIAGVPAEDPKDIAGAADVVMGEDSITGGFQIVETSEEWDVDVLVHYSFARHLGYETIVARLNVIKEEAENVGIQVVERDAPDPLGEGGVTNAQNFILEDVPKVMEEFAGKKVAFFVTNCGMQEALQAAVLKEVQEGKGAFYPLPCCPSPFHAFPASLGLAVEPEDYGNIDAYIQKAAQVLEKSNALGNFSTWAVPVNMSMISGGFAYAKDYIENGGERADLEKLTGALTTVAGAKATLTPFENADGEVIENYVLIYFDNIDFADYL